MKRIKKIQVFSILLILMFLLEGCGGNSYKKGLEALEDKKYDQAKELFEKAVEQKKNTADAYRGLGIALWESEDYKGAKSAFEKAVKAGAKKNGTLCNFLGSCELRAGDAKEAVTYYEDGLKDKENSEELTQEMRYNLIVAYEKTGNVEKAKELLDEYVSEYPQDTDAAKEVEFLETR